jgi:hypothetical protein
MYTSLSSAERRRITAAKAQKQLLLLRMVHNLPTKLSLRLRRSGGDDDDDPPQPDPQLQSPYAPMPLRTFKSRL